MRVSVTSCVIACAAAISELSPEALSRRTISRFTRGHPDNSVCWDRHGVDSFYSVIDAHNHPTPFQGPGVPFDLYASWMIEHGFVFGIFMGIGQRIVPRKPNASACCYYLHCPTFDYPVLPTTEGDVTNARLREQFYVGKLDQKVHIRLAATFANLQEPAGAVEQLHALQAAHPMAFTWSGELNVFKHALVGNGFFTHPRVTVLRVESGEYDALFGEMGPAKPNGEHIPVVTLHSDMGCDTYEHSIPTGAGDGVHPLTCYVPEEEAAAAQKEHSWWEAELGVYYSAFFETATHRPKPNFRKIMHLHVLDAILARYKEVKFVWAHLGLSMELQSLHPAVHAHILERFYLRHATNLWSDASWDVLAKLSFMNYKGEEIGAQFGAAVSEDFPSDDLWDAKALSTERERLDKVWQLKKAQVHRTSSSEITGPSFKMVVLLNLMHRYPERVLTGTDYVASYGKHADYPGYTPHTGAPLSPSTGCEKTDENHAMQTTDTGSINMFFDDALFSQAVLGGNFFAAAGISNVYAPPPICRADAVRPSEHGIPGTVLAATAAAAPMDGTQLSDAAATTGGAGGSWPLPLSGLLCAVAAVGIAGRHALALRRPLRRRVPDEEQVAYEAFAPRYSLARE